MYQLYFHKKIKIKILNSKQVEADPGRKLKLGQKELDWINFCVYVCYNGF